MSLRHRSDPRALAAHPPNGFRPMRRIPDSGSTSRSKRIDSDAQTSSRIASLPLTFRVMSNDRSCRGSMKVSWQESGHDRSPPQRDVERPRLLFVREASVKPEQPRTTRSFKNQARAPRPHSLGEHSRECPHHRTQRRQTTSLDDVPLAFECVSLDPHVQRWVARWLVRNEKPA